MMTTERLTRARVAVADSIHKGYLEVEAGYPSPGNPLNDQTRELIAAFAEANGGGCWLGKVNLYDQDRGRPVLWKWDGGTVLNFSCRLLLPCYDAELERLILERDAAPYTGTREDGKRVDAIFERVAALGGRSLFWN